MALPSPRKRLRQEVTCPICLEYFTGPVTLACEHSFCRCCIVQVLEISPTRALCPLCKRAFHIQDLQPNYNVISFVKVIKFLNMPEEADKRDICGRHQEPLKLFCKDHKVLICTSCEKEHQGHSLILVAEAAQERKDLMLASLEALEKRKEKMTQPVLDVQEEIDEMLEQMEAERKKIETKFQAPWLFLMKQEACTLTRMKRSRKVMERKRHQHWDQLNQRLSSLEDLIQEMEEKKELPASQLLQDVGSILKRCQQKVQLKNPVGCLPKLKQKVSAFAETNAILERAVKEFKESVASCY